MPKTNYYNDVKILKRSLKSRVKSFFVIILCLATIGGCFGAAMFLSSALTVGNISKLIAFGNYNIKYKNSNIYAVTLGEYDDFAQAEQVAVGASIQGAGGFVWTDDKHWVIGSVYLKLSDATVVVDNLKDSKYDVKIKEINLPKLNLDFGEYEKNQVKDIKVAMALFDDVYNDLYDYSIKIDKKQVNNLAVSSHLSSLKSRVKISIIALQTILDKPNDKVQTIQNGLIKLDELLDVTTIKMIENSAINHVLKNSLCKSARIKYDSFEQLC